MARDREKAEVNKMRTLSVRDAIRHGITSLMFDILFLVMVDVKHAS
jgi:hypothetical protein